MTVATPDAISTLAPEATVRLTDFARACKAAARAVVLYPAGHPAVGATLGRLVHLTAAERQQKPLVITVLADALLLDGLAPPRIDPTLAELAAALHSHLIGQLTVNPGGTVDEWRRFLLLIGRTPDQVRAEGGVAAVWTALAGTHVEITELDYAQVLRDGKGSGSTGQWTDLVSHCLRRQREGLDAAGRKALFDATGDPKAFGEIVAALDGEAVRSGGDIQARAEALVSLFDGVVASVTEHEPSHIDRALVTVASALSQISPDLMASLLSQPPDLTDTPGLVDTVLSHMSEDAVAHFVAQNALVGGTPMERLAQAFQVLVPDDRRERVLSLAKAEAASGAGLDQSGFEQLWGGIAQKLLVSYSDKAYVSDQYGRELSRARTSAVDVERTGDDPPDRMEAWLSSLSGSELRRLDHQLMLDLLELEGDPERWATLMSPAVALINDQLLVGDVDGAGQLITVLLRERRGSGHRTAATRALETLASGHLVRQITEHLGTLDEVQFEQVSGWLVEIGGLAKGVADELTGAADATIRDRLTRLLVAFGAEGRAEVERLRRAPTAAGRRAAVLLLKRFGGTDALSELTGLLSDDDSHVARDAVAAILDLRTERAHSVLGQAVLQGPPAVRQAILGAAEARDTRAVPVFTYLLRSLDRRGPSLDLYLKSLYAVGTIGDASGVPAVAQALLRGEWWAPRRTARIRRAAAAALARIGEPTGTQALEAAIRTGSRGVRAAARPALSSGGSARGIGPSQ